MENDSDLDKKALFALTLGRGRKIRIQYHSKIQSLTISELIRRAIDEYLNKLDHEQDEYLRKIETN